MTLIKCPECGKEISDKSKACIHCGYPLGSNLLKERNTRDNLFVECPSCHFANRTGNAYCKSCGKGFQEAGSSGDDIKYGQQNEVKVYRYSLLGNKMPAYCPRCGSANCSIYTEQKYIPGKTKTRYTVNLNPLKPFTLVNKKEKVIKKDKVYTESKFICDECGMIFL